MEEVEGVVVAELGFGHHPEVFLYEWKGINLHPQKNPTSFFLTKGFQEEGV